VTPEERRKFLEEHRVLGVERVGKAPHLTPVYYVLDGDDLIVSITRSRVKANLIEKAQRVTFCVLHEEFPFDYVAVTGMARLEDEGAVDVMAQIGEKMYGRPVGPEMRPMLEERAQKEGRIVLRITPESYYAR
jgi:nitroimidazol reductase NimA-like FMN-containing flavoprotein (pyridoxamine 5'-phosphate oxidase superfamily)